MSVFLDALSDAWGQMTQTLAFIARAFGENWRTGLAAILDRPAALLYVVGVVAVLGLTFSGLTVGNRTGHNRGLLPRPISLAGDQHAKRDRRSATAPPLVGGQHSSALRFAVRGAPAASAICAEHPARLCVLRSALRPLADTGTVRPGSDRARRRHALSLGAPAGVRLPLSGPSV